VAERQGQPGVPLFFPLRLRGFARTQKLRAARFPRWGNGLLAKALKALRNKIERRLQGLPGFTGFFYLSTFPPSGSSSPYRFMLLLQNLPVTLTP